MSREREPGWELKFEETKKKGKTKEEADNGALGNINLCTFPGERRERLKQKKLSEQHRLGTNNINNMCRDPELVSLWTKLLVIKASSYIGMSCDTVWSKESNEWGWFPFSRKRKDPLSGKKVNWKSNFLKTIWQPNPYYLEWVLYIVCTHKRGSLREKIWALLIISSPNTWRPAARSECECWLLAFGK